MIVVTPLEVDDKLELATAQQKPKCTSACYLGPQLHIQASAHNHKILALLGVQN